MTKIKPVLLMTIWLAASVTCYGQNESLSFGGKAVHLGQAKTEVLRLVPTENQAGLHSMEEPDGNHLMILNGNKGLGSIGFTNGRVSCIVTDVATYGVSERISGLSESLLAYFDDISGGKPTPVTLSTEVWQGSGLTVNIVHIRKGAYQFDLSRGTGLGEPVVALTKTLGSCSGR